MPETIVADHLKAHDVWVPDNSKLYCCLIASPSAGHFKLSNIQHAVQNATLMLSEITATDIITDNVGHAQVSPNDTLTPLQTPNGTQRRFTDLLSLVS